MKKGRRLPEAYRYAVGELNRGLAEANAWTPESRCAGGAHTWLASQACVRATFELGMRKIHFLDKVPYLLARLSEPGVPQRCIDQWNSCDEDKHHRVTVEFLSPTGSLRRHIDKYNTTSGDMSDELRREVDSLAAIPLDDSAAESPHAVAHRLMGHSRAATWPWVAATMRLDQNLRDAREVPAFVDSSFDDLWASHTNVLRGPSSRARYQTKKVNAKQLQANVYLMTFAHDRSQTGASILQAIGDLPSDTKGEAAPLAIVDDPNASEPSHLVAGGRKRKHAGREVACADSSGTQHKAVVAGRHETLFSKRNSEEARLARQFLAACLAPNSFVSVPVQNEEGDRVAQFFQVLAVESRAIVIKTFMAPEDADPSEALFLVSVQPLERWRPDESMLTSDSPPQEVFTYHDPCTVDILQVCGGLANREAWVLWQAQQSDVDGCLMLHSPMRLAPDLPLGAEDVPVLCLLDALHEQGFVGVGRKVLHTAPEGRLFDNRKLSSKRKYLQCVIARDGLLPAVGDFPSTEPASFYEALMLLKRPIKPGLGDAMYKKMIAGATGSASDADAALLDRAHSFAPLPAGSAQEEKRAALNDMIVGGDSEDDAPIAEAAPAPAAICDGDASIVGDSGGEEAPEGGDMFPDKVLGQPLRRVRGKHDRGWNYEDRLAVACSNPSHPRCNKSRSVALGAATHGPLSAVYFLGAWLARASEMTEAEHRRYMPNVQAVRDFARTYEQ